MICFPLVAKERAHTLCLDRIYKNIWKSGDRSVKSLQSVLGLSQSLLSVWHGHYSSKIIPDYTSVQFRFHKTGPDVNRTLPSTLLYLTHDTTIRLHIRFWSNLLHTDHMLHLHLDVNIAPNTSCQLYSKSICMQQFSNWSHALYITFRAQTSSRKLESIEIGIKSDSLGFTNR